MQLGAVGWGESHIGQHVSLGFIHEGGEFGGFRPQLVWPVDFR
jgi:hypothetical protein